MFWIIILLLFILFALLDISWKLSGNYVEPEPINLEPLKNGFENAFYIFNDMHLSIKIIFAISFIIPILSIILRSIRVLGGRD